MTIQTRRGNLIALAIEGYFDVIVQGCNCFHTMGGGLARQIREQFPAAYQADLATPRGDRAKLGTYSFARYEREPDRLPLTIVNGYTQFSFGGGLQVDYEAVDRLMQRVAVDFDGHRIGLPMIGAGLAGGDWPTLRAIIDKRLGEQDCTIVEFDPSA